MTAKPFKVAFALLILLAVCSSQNSKTLTARDYYNELLKAKALEDPASYACFSDKDDDTNFFTIMRAESKDLPTGFYDQFSKDTQAAWDRGFIHVIEYWKGVPSAIDYLKDGDSWTKTSKKDNGSGVPPTIFTLRISINWKTLRYVRPPVQLCTGDFCSASGNTDSGRCEIIQGDITIHQPKNR